MKKLLIIAGALLLFVNIFAGLLISSYKTYYICLSSVIIILTTILNVVCFNIEQRDTFKISLLPVFSLVGIIEFILAFWAPDQFEDNWYLIVVLGILAIEVVLLFVTKSVSDKIN